MATKNPLMDALKAMVSDMVVDDAPKAKRITSEQRKDRHREMLEQFDLDKLLAMQEKMSKAIDLMTANSFVDDAGEVALTPARAEALMIEMLDQIDIKELVEVRREAIRTAVFAHLTEEAERRGEADPEFVPGTIPVPSLGKKFVREGGNRAAPTLDETMFRQALGEDWEQAYNVEVVPEQIIPAHVQHTLDPEKVMALADANPAVLEALRKSLIPGDRRTPSFTVRNL